jgi:hypothetical protein
MLTSTKTYEQYYKFLWLDVLYLNNLSDFITVCMDETYSEGVTSI